MKKVNYHLTEALIATVAMAAKKEQVSQSELVRVALREYFVRHYPQLVYPPEPPAGDLVQRYEHEPGGGRRYGND